jgi:hypothetical protein
MNREEALKRQAQRRTRKVCITNYEQEAALNQSAAVPSNPTPPPTSDSPNPTSDSPPPECESPPDNPFCMSPSVADPARGHSPDACTIPQSLRPKAKSPPADILVWVRYVLALILGLVAPPMGFLCFVLIDISAGIVLPWVRRKRTAAGLLLAFTAWVHQVRRHWGRVWLVMIMVRAAVQVSSPVST